MQAERIPALLFFHQVTAFGSAEISPLNVTTILVVKNFTVRIVDMSNEIGVDFVFFDLCKLHVQRLSVRKGEQCSRQ